MNRAEEAALKAYPEKIIEHVEEPGFVVKRDLNRFDRNVYIQGYEQAEKDLALTWEDVKNLDYLLNDVNFENGRAEFLGKEIPFDGDEGFYGEVLKRFNSQREKK